MEPALQKVAPETIGHANRHLNKLDSNYNNIKNKVLDAHGQAEHHINYISGKLKSKNTHRNLIEHIYLKLNFSIILYNGITRSSHRRLSN